MLGMLLEDADGNFPPISCWSVGGGGGGVLLCVERSYDNYLVGKKVEKEKSVVC